MIKILKKIAGELMTVSLVAGFPLVWFLPAAYFLGRIDFYLVTSFLTLAILYFLNSVAIYIAIKMGHLKILRWANLD